MEWHASLVKARVVLLVRGLAGEASSGADRCGQVRNGMAGKAGLVTVCPDAERCGRLGKVSSGLVRSGKVVQASYG